MTEDPQTGSPAGTGAGGRPGDMPTGHGAEAGGTGTGGQGRGSASDASRIATAKRASAEANVPQQAGNRQERAGQGEIYGQDEMVTPGVAPSPPPSLPPPKVPGAWC